MADPAQHQPQQQQQQQQQTGPAITGPAATAPTAQATKLGNTTIISSDGTVKHVASVTISPASSNPNLKFDEKFEEVFLPSSLRRAFSDHDAYGAVFEQSRDGFGFNEGLWGGGGSHGPKKFPGKIVALSEDFAAARGGAAKSSDTSTPPATPPPAAATDGEFTLTAAPKGFVSAVMTAYNRHCNLVLSPDDVWLAILGQFCAYVNKHAEALRYKIVEHEGKKELKAYSPGSLETADYEGMIRKLLAEIRGNIKSPELADWFRPGFSTTTWKDEVCAAATAMASLQAYFEYRMCTICGIPSVTMLGTVADWKLLREKVDRLLEFEVEDNPEGNVMDLWVGYLRKACDGFVESAEHPGSEKTLEFWDKVLSHNRMGSGMDTISGWLSAFTCFNGDGKFVGKRKNADAEFPSIEEMNIAHNVLSCPVKIDDNGDVHDGTLFVGQVAFEAERGGGEDFPTVRPRNDWCMAVPAKK